MCLQFTHQPCVDVEDLFDEQSFPLGIVRPELEEASLHFELKNVDHKSKLHHANAGDQFGRVRLFKPS